jgi:nickel transport protein
MRVVQRGLVIAVLWTCLLAPAGTLYAQSPVEPSPESVAALFKEQNSKLSGELRRIQREIAALRADLDKPRLKDVFSGIGYIFGLFGVAAFVAARRKE